MKDLIERGGLISRKDLYYAILPLIQPHTLYSVLIGGVVASFSQQKVASNTEMATYGSYLVMLMDIRVLSHTHAIKVTHFRRQDTLVRSTD